MTAGTRFLICSCVILIFTIINFGVGPAINKRAGVSLSYVDCSYYSDLLDEYKKSNPSPEDKTLKTYEDFVTMCRRGKAMYHVEYTTFIFNIIISFICTLLGFYGLEKEMIIKTSRIGLLCGVTGFIMTFIYVILNGITYTSTLEDTIYKLDSDGAYAKLDNIQKKYLCLFYEEGGSQYSIYAKFSDLIKSQYNYNKKLSDSFDNDPEHKNCLFSSYIKTCAQNQYLDLSVQTYTVDGESRECTKLYCKILFTDNKNYDISARFLAALIFSIFSFIGFLILAYNSYLLSKE